jgi:Cell morphogenesis N-terminal
VEGQQQPIIGAIGLEQYYLPCRKAFDAILRTLDLQVGRPLMLTSSQVKGKEYDDVVVGDVRPKLDLLRLCLAAIPRLLPDPMAPSDLIDLLARMTIHIDEELRVSAYQALQNIVADCTEWREETIHVILRFFNSNMTDSLQNLIESTGRLLLQLLTTWRAHNESTRPKPPSTVDGHLPNMVSNSTIASKTTTGTLLTSTSSISSEALKSEGPGGRILTSPQIGAYLLPLQSPTAYALHCVEGLALVLLCQMKSQTRKLAISILRECKLLISQLTSPVSSYLSYYKYGAEERANFSMKYQ